MPFLQSQKLQNEQSKNKSKQKIIILHKKSGKKDKKYLQAKNNKLPLHRSNEQTKNVHWNFATKKAVGEPRQNGVLTFNISSMEQTKVLLEIIYLFVSIVSVVLSLTENGKRK